MSFRSVLVCYTAGFTTIITTLRRITIGKEIYFLRTRNFANKNNVSGNSGQ